MFSNFRTTTTTMAAETPKIKSVFLLEREKPNSVANSWISYSFISLVLMSICTFAVLFLNSPLSFKIGVFSHSSLLNMANIFRALSSMA